MEKLGAKKLLTLTALLVSMSAQQSVEAINVTPGWDGVIGQDVFGVRYRSFKPTGAEEIYLGVPDLGTPSNRVAQQVDWGAGPSAFNFSFQYDPVNDKLVSTVGGNAPLEYTFTPDLDIGTLQLTVSDRDANGEVWMTNLMVNGELAGTGTFLFNDEGFKDWMLTDLNPAVGLNVTGTINRTGSFGNSQEKSKIEIRARERATAVPDTGAGAALLGAAFMALMTVRQRRLVSAS